MSRNVAKRNPHLMLQGFPRLQFTDVISLTMVMIIFECLDSAPPPSVCALLSHGRLRSPGPDPSCMDNFPKSHFGNGKLNIRFIRGFVRKETMNADTLSYARAPSEDLKRLLSEGGSWRPCPT